MAEAEKYMAEVNEAKREKSQVEDINRSCMISAMRKKTLQGRRWPDPRHCRADFPREERPRLDVGAALEIAGDL